MRFEPLKFEGVYVIELERHEDERGFFARLFCEDEFAAQGLVNRFTQSSLSHNKRRGTVRGMHFSVDPFSETKLVRCTAGAICDIIIDLRPQSPTYLEALLVELSAENGRALYIPAHFAHGFQTLRDETQVHYMIDRPFVASAARGLRWNDPAVSIAWPLPISVIAERDMTYPDFAP